MIGSTYIYAFYIEERQQFGGVTNGLKQSPTPPPFSVFGWFSDINVNLMSCRFAYGNRF